MPLPLPISERHKNLHLCMDIFYVNGLIFLHSKTGKIDFLSVKSLTSKGATPFIKALEEIKKYDKICFKITDYHGDK